MSLAQGSDAILNQKFGYQAYNRLKNHFEGPDPGDLQDGMIWFDSGAQAWFGKRAAGLFNFTLTPPAFPEGMIIPWVGGYFTNGSNAGYTRVLGASNDPAGVNGLFNSSGWYVCDGAALNIPESTIYDGPGRYLPNLTDDRFLMGDLAVGAVGGSSTMAHTHTGPAHTHTGPSHNHGFDGTTDSIGNHAHSCNPPDTPSDGPSALTGIAEGTGGETIVASMTHHHHVNIAEFSSGNAGGHSHGFDGTTDNDGTGATGSGGTGATGAASNAENRPAFLSVMYLQYVLSA